MLELLISELLKGQGGGFRDTQSLLRLLGPLGSGVIPTGELGVGTGFSSSGGGAAGVLRMVSSGGGFLGLPGLVQSLFGRREQPVVAAPPLRLMKYQAPAAYNEEYAIAARQGIQVVTRQDEFGRSEARRQQEVGEEVNPTTTGSQGLDGRVFLQYSDEIAQAVRQALLYSHPLRELISE